MLISAMGIMAGLFLYEYTDYFSSLRGLEGEVAEGSLDLYRLALLYFDQVAVMTVLFLFGFTLFAPIVSALILAYKGFMTSFTVVYFGMYYEIGSISKLAFGLMSAVLIIMLTIYIVLGAKAIAFSGSLRYACPDLASLIHRQDTHKYLITFLLLCCFMLLTTAAKYYIPLL